MSGAGDCLILFAKPPIAGRVKTRLIPVVGAEAAAGLYRQLLEHALKTASCLQGVRKELWWDGPRDDEGCAYAERFGMRLRHQGSGDLGERMHRALASALESSERAVLIGSDSPEYDADYLGEAFSVLERNDAVVGPAVDGGYLLIGMKQPNSRLFQNMPWSSDRVLGLTRQRLKELDWDWRELPTRRDVDVADDLAHFPGLMRYSMGTS